MTDGSGDTASGLLSYTLEGVDDDPTGESTARLSSGTEDEVYEVSLSDLLSGFTDADGDDLSVVNLISSEGTVSALEGDTYRITPSADYAGEVSLSYDVTDGSGDTASGLLSYTLEGVDDGPTSTTIEHRVILPGNQLEIDLQNYFEDIDSSLSFDWAFNAQAGLSANNIDLVNDSILTINTEFAALAGETILNIEGSSLGLETSQTLNISVVPPYSYFQAAENFDSIVTDYASGIKNEYSDNAMLIDDYLYLGELNFDFDNFNAGKKGEDGFISPTLTFELDKYFATNDTVELGEVKIRVFDIVAAEGFDVRQKDNTAGNQTGEREFNLSFNVSANSTNGIYSLDNYPSGEIYAMAYYITQSGLKIRSSIKSDIENETIVYDQQEKRLEINFLDLIDEFSVAQYLPLDRQDYYMIIEGIPLQSSDEMDVLSIEATVSLI